MSVLDRALDIPRNLCVVALICASALLAAFPCYGGSLAAPKAPRPPGTASSARSYRVLVKLSYDAGQLRETEVQLSGTPYRRVTLVDVPLVTEEIGKPRLPIDQIVVILPPDAIDVALDAHQIHAHYTKVDKSLGGRRPAALAVEPLQPPEIPSLPRLTDPPGNEPTPPDPFVIDEAAYRSDEPYPGPVAELVSVTTRYGARVAVLRVVPLTYIARSGHLDILSRAEIPLVFRSAVGLNDLYQGLSPDKREILARQAINPTMLGSGPLQPPPPPNLGSTHFVVHTSAPAHQERVPYVVITSTPLASSFQPLVDYKKSKGVNARLVTLDFIVARYPGVDRANRMRNFLIDVANRWQTSYVLLGGDVEEVPTRHGFYDEHLDSIGPTDLYFAAHDGIWNGNGNVVFGEDSELWDPFPDGVDIDPDLAIGRAPARNAADAATFVSKVIAYESTPDLAHTNDALLMGIERGGRNSANPLCCQWTFHVSKESYKDHIFQPAGVTVSTLYDSYDNLYYGPVPTAPLDRARALQYLSYGPHATNHMDHSGPEAMGTGSAAGGGAITNQDVDGLFNNPTVLWTLGCDPNAFDLDSISEHFINNPHGGAVAFVGNSRTGWTGQDIQDNQFWARWYSPAASLPRLGPILQSTQGLNFGHYYSRAMNLLGDPEMPVWSRTPDPLAILGLPATLVTGPNALNLSIANLLPDEEAVIAFEKPADNVYEVFTSSNGNLVTKLVVPTAGSLRLTVTSRNRLPFTTLVPVSASVLAQLHVVSVAVIDTAGNANGQIESGESVTLRITISNGGGVASTPVNATLGALQAGILIGTPSLAVPALAPSTPFTADFAVSFQNTVFLEDGDVAQLGLMTFFLSETQIALPVFRGDLVQSHSWVDGNDGIPAAADTVAMDLHVVNQGYGLAKGVVATITAATTGIQVLSGTASVGDVPPKGAKDAPNSFSLLIGASFDPAVDTIDLRFTDSLGNTWTHAGVELVVPDPPQDLSFEGTSTSIRVKWTPPNPSLRRYRVVRSTSTSGPFADLEPLFSTDASYRDDIDLTPGIVNYSYRVAVIDPSGNESQLDLPAAQVDASTGLDLDPDFPRSAYSTHGQIIGPTVAQDLDGDGTKELFAQAGHHDTGWLYAWKSDGSPLLPLVGDPSAAEFAQLDAFNAGAPVFADLDGDGALDVITAGFCRIFAFDRDGTPVPGWAGGVVIDPACIPGSSCPGGSVSFTTPAVADLDGDGSAELLVVSQAWNFWDCVFQPTTTSLLHVLSNTGAVLRTFDDPDQDLSTYSFATPAVADVDGDGNDEAIVIGHSGDIFLLDASTTPSAATLSLIATIPGPGWGPQTSRGASIGNLDNDCELEFVVQCPMPGGGPSDQPPPVILPEDRRLYAFNIDGTPVPGWELAQTDDSDATVALADLDGDGRMEVAYAGHDVYLFEHDGALKWSAARLGKPSSAVPLVADVDADGDFDVLVGSEMTDGRGVIQAWDGATGTSLLHFPMVVPDPIRTTGTLVDLDGDGRLSLAVGAGRKMYAWITDGDPTPGPWPQQHHDLHDTSAVPICGDVIRTGVNIGASYSPSTYWGSELVAVKYVPTEWMALKRIEVFTGDAKLPSSVGVWTDNPGLNQPGRLIRSAAFLLDATRSWQGATLDRPASLEPGVPVWIVWKSVSGALGSTDITTSLLPFRESTDGGNTWLSVPTPFAPFKFRLQGCSFLTGSNLGPEWDAGNFAASGVIAFLHQPTYDGTLARAEIFTAGTGPYTLELWREGTFKIPTVRLAAAAFTMQPGPSWQGVSFDPPYPLNEGTTYFLVWHRRGGELESYESGGPDTQVAQVAATTAGPWAFLLANRFKVRLLGGGYTPPLHAGVGVNVASLTSTDLAVQVRARATADISRIELFTGDVSGSETMAIWSDDSLSSAPAELLSSGTFVATSTRGWQGAESASSVRLVAGKTYWVVWSLLPGALGPFDGSVQSLEARTTRESFDSGSSWSAAVPALVKLRLLSCARPTGCAPCPTTCEPATPVRMIADLESISFWESTFAPAPPDESRFSSEGPELATRLTDKLDPGNSDFYTAAEEYYDVFYSDANGTFNVDGRFVTIEARHDHASPSGGGLNIAEVQLNFAGGATEYASSVASSVGFGDNYISGSEILAIDGDMFTDTTMGNTVAPPPAPQRLRLTVRFACP